jgi:hypothetical protein
MSDDAKRKWAEAIRAFSLAHNTAHYTYGILPYAGPATAGRKVQQMLRDIARDIANNVPQTLEERAFLNQLLLALADGRDVLAELHIDRPKVGHRKADPLNRDLTQMVDWLIADGMTKTTAFEKTAAILHKGIDAVRKGYYKGKRVENDMRQRMLAIEEALPEGEKR